MNVENQPFFIVGSDRSGTTLLRLMLNQHPRLRVPRESWFMPKLMDNLPLDTPLDEEQVTLAFQLIASHSRWEDLETSNETLWEIFSTVENPTLGALIDALFRYYATSSNKSRWGDKTPSYVKEIERLHQVFPQAKFIHIIRDGRDVYLSLRRKKWHGTTVEEIAEYWCEMVNAGIESGRALGHPYYLEVAYEDLVLKSEETLTQICAFLGEEYHERMLGFYKSAGTEISPLERQVKFHEKTKRPPQNSDVFRWRTEMNWIQLALFEERAGAVMEHVGQVRSVPGDSLTIPLAVNTAPATYWLRKWWGYCIPYSLMRKMGLGKA